MKLDSAQKTLSVNTTHFSDWDLFESVRMVPVIKAIDPGQSVEVAIRRWKSDFADDLFPLIPEDQEKSTLARFAIGPGYFLVLIRHWQYIFEKENRRRHLVGLMPLYFLKAVVRCWE